MKDSRATLISPRLVIGLAIMVLGTLFLLDNMNVIGFGETFRFWPLAPIAVGLTLLVQPSGSTNRAFGGFLVGVGVWVLLNDFDIIGVSLSDAWPVLLIGVGGWFVWRSFSGEDEPFAGPHSPDQPRNGERVSGADTLSALAFVGHVERTSVSQNFQGGDLTAIMGGCTIDLSGADIGEGGAVVDAFAFWGGIEIVVPEDWVVTNKVLPLLGGSEDKSRAIPGASKQLLVRGTAIMGGVKIANQRDDS